MANEALDEDDPSRKTKTRLHLLYDAIKFSGKANPGCRVEDTHSDSRHPIQDPSEGFDVEDMFTIESDALADRLDY